MSRTDQASFRNRLLTALPPQVFAALSAHLEPIDLPVKRVLVEPNLPVEHLVFVESGIASVVTHSSDGESVEVGHVGPEGMSGGHVFLGSDSTPNETFVQAAGNGVAVSTRTMLDVVEQSREARDLFLAYVHSCEIQLAQSALANARYNINERLARWLLMCHDRIDGPDLPLTHEFLALMLGVRRSGVTNEIHVLESLGAIRATRGNVRVLDRSKLEEIAAGCYGVPEREYERLIGIPMRRPS